MLLYFLYMPPSSRVDWFGAFSNNLDIYLENKEIQIMGDSNINLLNVDNKVNRLMEILNSVNLKQIVCEPTRVTDSTKTLIDHAYVSNPGNIIQCRVHKFGVSDHYPCVVKKIYE